jgi:DNA-directed RNA polymerase specialized sigma24 family protein
MARVSSLSPDALDMLLARFHPDRDLAAADYERCRARLVKFFEWKHCEGPDHLADETLDRVALRICSGERIDNLAAFIHGVAINVGHEHFHRPIEVPIEIEVLRHLPVEDPRQIEKDAVAELQRSQRLERQRRCLERLRPEERDLIAAYHVGRGRERIQARRALATRVGIGLNALRIRAHRIRSWLMTCVGTTERIAASSPVKRNDARSTYQ